MPWLLSCVVWLGGCLNTSEVQLAITVPEATLEAVEQFPVRVLVDMGVSQNRELHICDWQGGFLETSVSVNTYDTCPESFTIEGVVVPLVGACDGGAFRFSQDWPDEDTILYGQGSIEVFESGACNTLEDRALSIGPVVVE